MKTSLSDEERDANIELLAHIDAQNVDIDAQLEGLRDKMRS